MSQTPENSPILGRRGLLKAGVAAGAALALSKLDLVPGASAAEESLSLAGKRIAISATGTDHYWDLKAYQAQIEEVKTSAVAVVALSGIVLV